MNRNGVRYLLTAILALTLGGCGGALVGSWKADAAPKDGDFFINTATFRDDGTYTAVAKKGEENVQLVGKYEFDGFHLKLKTPGKPERAYSATYYMNGKLSISDGKTKQMLSKQ
jgi:hypothetical protein